LHQILQQEVREPGLNRISQYDRNRFLKRTPIVETASNGYSNLRQEYSTALIVLMCMAALILLIACSNVANLLIARALARQKEIAVHLALGETRRNLIARLITESMLLSLAGALLGLVLSFVTTRGLLTMLPASGAALTLHARPDSRILLFSTGLALITALLFGVAPALQAAKLDIWAALKDVVSAVTGSSSTRLRKSLVGGQVALSFLLLVGAGLFVRTLVNLKDAHTGFRRIDNLVSFQVDPTKDGYSLPRVRSFYTNLLNEIRAIPGVKSAAYAMFPLLNGKQWDLTVAVEGHPGKEGEDMQAYYNLVSPGYWRAMGISLLEGRDFDERDRFDGAGEGQPPTRAIVNREFVERYFDARSPVGRHIGCCRGAATKPDIQIVG
ncbi:MAG: FtsX-like permease family protein, partial [Bryobacteraceae bacterium]